MGFNCNSSGQTSVSGSLRTHNSHEGKLTLPAQSSAGNFPSPRLNGGCQNPRPSAALGTPKLKVVPCYPVSDLRLCSQGPTSQCPGGEHGGDKESQALPRPAESEPTGNRTPRTSPDTLTPQSRRLGMKFLAYAVVGSGHVPNLLSSQYQMCVCVCVCSATSVMSDSLRPHGL